MAKRLHQLYIIFLVGTGLFIALFVGWNGWEYYTTPLELRPYLKQHETMKPGGMWGHGLGVIGSTLMVFGVLLYSSRKRVRALSTVGKLQYFLEFHIFLCLLGPTLVLYHTTFKFGGIVRVSVISMLAVVASGFVGRYLYMQIPRSISGSELTVAELEKQNQQLALELEERFGISEEILRLIDSIASVSVNPATLSTFSVLGLLIKDALLRRIKIRYVKQYLLTSGVGTAHIHDILRIAKRKALLIRKITFLEVARKWFHYWHVVHLPFTFVMFTIMVAHIVVVVVFGYRWIF